ncbi:MAG: hypothetical protein K2O88_03200, partial [Paramuribaculum sp.]|nr:hypothetical protein [Paramuribaculum sp.]
MDTIFFPWLWVVLYVKVFSSALFSSAKHHCGYIFVAKMATNTPHTTIRVPLPNYLHGFQRHCSLWLNHFERSVFATLERNRQHGHNVRLYYNQTRTYLDDQFLDRLVSYAWWIDALRLKEGCTPMQVAVITLTRAYGENFAKRLPGQVKVYTPRGLRSSIGRSFDMVFILCAHLLRRCPGNRNHYTYYEQAVTFHGHTRYLFVTGRHNPRSRLAGSFHVFYRRHRAVQQREPWLYSAFTVTDPTPNVTTYHSLPVGYELPDLPPRQDLPSYPCLDCDDTEILLGYQIGLADPPEPQPHTARHAIA